MGGWLEWLLVACLAWINGWQGMLVGLQAGWLAGLACCLALLADSACWLFLSAGWPGLLECSLYRPPRWLGPLAEWDCWLVLLAG
jgi:hypothetical protein